MARYLGEHRWAAASPAAAAQAPQPPSIAQPPGPDAEPPSLAEVAALPQTTLLSTEEGSTSQGRSGGGGISTQSTKLGVNLNGCYGQTDYPHKSTIYASVHGRTKCTLNSQNLSVATTLYRNDWWGLNYMADGTASRASGTSSGDATPHSSCDYAPSRTYTGLSGHTVTIGGVLYSANTSSSATFACNY